MRRSRFHEMGRPGTRRLRVDHAAGRRRRRGIDPSGLDRPGVGYEHVAVVFTIIAGMSGQALSRSWRVGSTGLSKYCSSK